MTVVSSSILLYTLRCTWCLLWLHVWKLPVFQIKVHAWLTEVLQMHTQTAKYTQSSSQPVSASPWFQFQCCQLGACSISLVPRPGPAPSGGAGDGANAHPRGWLIRAGTEAYRVSFYCMWQYLKIWKVSYISNCRNKWKCACTSFIPDIDQTWQPSLQCLNLARWGSGRFPGSIGGGFSNNPTSNTIMFLSLTLYGLV